MQTYVKFTEPIAMFQQWIYINVFLCVAHEEYMSIYDNYSQNINSLAVSSKIIINLQVFFNINRQAPMIYIQQG